MRALVVGAAAVALVSAGACTATAATVRVGSGVVVYAAAQGETNDVTVSSTANTVTVTEASAPLTTGKGCHVTAPGVAECAVQAGFPVRATLGNGNDRIAAGPERDDVTGGLGDDTIATGPGKDVVREGDDPGARDVIDGGSEQDRLTYEGTRTPVHVDLAAGTGGAGGRDDVIAGIEDVTGSDAGGDVLLGDGGRNNLLGMVYGTGDDPRPMRGDRVAGRAGRDHLYGGPAADRLEGGDGDDDFSGSGGRDVIRGGPGSDVVQPGVDVPPRVDCGPGRDLVDLYGGAMILRSCELLSSLHGTAVVQVRGRRLTVRFPHLHCVTLRLGRSGPEVRVPSRRGGRAVFTLPARRHGSVPVFGRVDCPSAPDHTFRLYFLVGLQSTRRS
jgi:Ca2+-binding RTX toxin-like protein